MNSLKLYYYRFKYEMTEFKLVIGFSKCIGSDGKIYKPDNKSFEFLKEIETSIGKIEPIGNCASYISLICGGFTVSGNILCF